MDEEWSEIPGFERYLISNMGRVQNSHSGHILAQQRNQTGARYVSLTRDKKLYVRGIAYLVINEFVYNDYIDYYKFNTPMHLDGDKNNNEYTNLVWRPRWWAIQYQKEFLHSRALLPFKLVETTTEEVFQNSLIAARRFGLVEYYVVMSHGNDKEAFFGLYFQRYEENLY